MRRTADAAQALVEQLRDRGGPPTRVPWSAQWIEAYETAPGGTSFATSRPRHRVSGAGIAGRTVEEEQWAQPRPEG